LELEGSTATVCDMTIQERTNSMKKMYSEGKLIREIAKKLRMTYGNVGYYLSVNKIYKKYPRKNSGRFSSIRQYSNRNKWTSKQSKAIQKKQWALVRQGKHIIRRSRAEGVVNPAWTNRFRGGMASLKKTIRGMSEYKQWRESVFERDNYTCQECFKRKSTLNPHHQKKSFKQILNEFLQKYNQFSLIDDKETLVRLSWSYEDFWDINNGVTLCEDCHKKTATYGYRKQNI